MNNSQSWIDQYGWPSDQIPVFTDNLAPVQNEVNTLTPDNCAVIVFQNQLWLYLF